jgi:3D (Asp-Asp-Asp) domain-containing protein
MRLVLCAGVVMAVLVAAIATPAPQRMLMEATAYCLRGRTASGTRVQRGVVAVDRRVIPLGTRLYVEGYGPAVARDTGGAIRGRRVDIWLPSRSQCMNWGRRRVRVIVNYDRQIHGATPFARPRPVPVTPKPPVRK